MEYILFLGLNACIYYLGFSITRIYELERSKVQHLFSLTFSVCFMLFILLIFEMGNIFSRDLRWLLYKYYLGIAVSQVLVTLPLIECWTFYSQIHGLNALKGLNNNPGRIIKYKSMATLLTTIIYLIIVKKCTQSFLPNEEVKDIFTLENNIMRVSVIGVALIAALSGFGAVHSPFTSISWFHTSISPQEIKNMEMKIDQTLSLIFRKKKWLLDNHHASSQSSGMFWFWKSRELQQYQWTVGEIEALESFLQDIYQDLDEANVSQMYTQDSKTLKGQIVNVMGYIFTLFCLFKIISSILGILFGSKLGVDPVTRILHLLVHFFRIELDVEFWSKPLSFLFVGVLILGSIRGLLMHSIRLFRRFSRYMNPDMIVLFISHIMGFYFISMVMMLKSSLPIENRSIISSLLGPIEFTFYQRWHDYIFLLSCFSSILILGLHFKLKRQQEKEKYKSF